MVAVMAKAGSGIYGVLAYNKLKTDNGKAVVIGGNDIVYTPGQTDIDIRLLEHCFAPNLKANNRTKYPIFHCSLNPHPDDKLSDGKLSELANEFMNELGYGNQPYVVIKHSDIAREHLHIVSVRVDKTGRKIKDSFEGERAGKIAAKLTERYNLKQSSDTEKQLLQPRKVDYAKSDIKRQVKSVLHSALDNYKFQSIGEMNSLLNTYGVYAEHKKGEVEGRTYEGIVYGVFQHGEKVGKPIKGSDMKDRRFMIPELNKHFEKSKKQFNPNTERIDRLKQIVDNGLYKSDLQSMSENLKAHGVDLMFRINDDKRITGITFIDHQSKEVFNGSRLGKDYSANYFESWLTIPETMLLDKEAWNIVQPYQAPVTSDEDLYNDYPSMMHGHDAWKPQERESVEPQKKGVHVALPKGGQKKEGFKPYKPKKRKKGRNV